jgi:hypothetical protein
LTDELDIQLAQNRAALDRLSEAASASWWSTKNAMTMSFCVLGFGVVVLALATWLIHRGKSTESVLRVFGTILIITSAIFLVVAGYSDTQISPVMGLLGTVAGYLLGKTSRRTDQDSRKLAKLSPTPPADGP